MDSNGPSIGWLRISRNFAQVVDGECAAHDGSFFRCDRRAMMPCCASAAISAHPDGETYCCSYASPQPSAGRRRWHVNSPQAAICAAVPYTIRIEGWRQQVPAHGRIFAPRRAEGPNCARKRRLQFPERIGELPARRRGRCWRPPAMCPRQCHGSGHPGQCLKTSRTDVSRHPGLASGGVSPSPTCQSVVWSSVL